MRQRVALLLVLWLSVMSSSNAHHPPLMEHCQALTFTGEIERVEWRNPHVELFVRSDEGERYRLTWLNMYQLGREGISIETLRAGDQVIVTVGTRDDLVEKPMLLSAITRASDGWEWSQVPQGC